MCTPAHRYACAGVHLATTRKDHVGFSCKCNHNLLVVCSPYACAYIFSLNQSANEPVSPSLIHSLTQLAHSLTQSTNQHTNQYINKSGNQPINQALNSHNLLTYSPTYALRSLLACSLSCLLAFLVACLLTCSLSYAHTLTHACTRDPRMHSHTFSWGPSLVRALVRGTRCLIRSLRVRASSPWSSLSTRPCLR